MSIADEYLKFLRLELPRGKTCAEFSKSKFQKDTYSVNGNAKLDRLFEDFRPLGGFTLFPEPLESKYAYYKGVDYLVAAIYYSQENVEAIYDRLKKVIQSINDDLDRITIVLRE